MEITRGGQKVALALSVESKNVRIPAGFQGRIYIDIDGKVIEVSERGRQVTFPEVKADSNIGYGWSAK